MKKYYSIVLASVALLFASSCSKEEQASMLEEGNLVDITVIASEKPEPILETGTRTFIDGTAVKWSDSGEKIKVWEVATPTEGDVVTSDKISSNGVTSDGGATMSFAVSMAEKSSGYESFDYYAVYPSSSYQTGSAVTSIALNTACAQTPSSTNFDASQDLLIAKKIENGASQATELEMQFARVVAIGKMTVKNLESSDDITKITFSAKIGDEDVILAGRTAFNLNTALPVSTYGSNIQEHAIILNYEGQGIKANTAGGMVAYFTCYPFEINSVNPGSIKVVVETATETFTKNVSVSSAKGLAFNIGKASVFSVDMDGIPGEAKAADLCYAYLELSDVSGDITSNTYVNASVTKSHGDTWSMFANMPASGCLGVRRNDGDKNDSYIKLPDFVNDIKRVVVTLNSPTSGKTITLESSATETGGTIADLTTTAASVYTFDLTSGPSVKTAYFRSTDATANIEKIEVYSGTDTRTALAAPTSVSAELNGSTANSIDVSWSSVDGALGYIITLVPDSGDDVVVKAASSPYTVTDLAYNMDYLVSVQAEPDYYINTVSAETTASDVVTTGSNLTGEVTLTTNEISMGSNTVQGTENGKLAYRLGTGSNDGSLTFDAGYSSITFKLEGWASGTRSFSVTNGTISDSNSLSPASGAASGNINAGFSRTDTGTEYTIVVDDPTEEVVFSGRRAIVWGFTAVEAVAAAVATPTFSVAEGTYNAAQSVTISCATVGAVIHYTTDGSTPTSSSPTYSAAINVNVSMTLKAIAIKESDESAIASATYTLKVAAPTFSPAGGSYNSTQSVTISCATGGAAIHYTTDGSTPTAGSPTYSSAISVSSTQTIKAIATMSGWTNSDVASASYTIGDSGPAIGTVMWAETWEGGTAGEKPSEYGFEGTTVYNSGSVTYTQSGTSTKLYDDTMATTNLLLAKSANSGVWTISGIPTGGRTSLTLSFESNSNSTGRYAISTSTANVSLGSLSTSGSSTPFTVTATITISGTVNAFNLTFTNGSSSNVRLDNLRIVTAN